MHSATVQAPRWVWLFGPGVGAEIHQTMADSRAQVLIMDLEDFTPPALKAQARAGCGAVLRMWRNAGAQTCVRINALHDQGLSDLMAVMPHAPDVIAYPMAERAEDLVALDQAITAQEHTLGLSPGQTEILPVCETARGVLDVRLLAAASPRVRAALLGTEDLAADLHAQRSPEGEELEHARRHFVMACRAAQIEPIDAPYTWAALGGAAQETRHAMQLGYRSKSLVRAEHVAETLAVLVPQPAEVHSLQRLVHAFEAARAAGQERALVDGLWVEVPTYRVALRRLAEAQASSKPPA